MSDATPLIDQNNNGATPLPLLLLVDDDPLIVDALSFALRREYRLCNAPSRPEAITLLDRLAAAPDLALVDLGLPPTPHRPDEGFALIRELVARSPKTRVIALSGQSDDSNARHARTLGAFDFVAKPCEPANLLAILGRAMQFDPANGGAGKGMIGESPAIQKLRFQLSQYADHPFPVLIEGESGCGKEIVARQHLHAATSRANQPFLALNCAAISPNLVEPTLFGHAKGAFTGASGARAGYFEEVGSGTLFLDEIGELPLDLQAKLLRVLENGEFQRVGETQTRRSNARIVAATNRDLRGEIRSGRFRADLYHRLSVFTIGVPPLREMGNDRFLLLDHFRKHYGALSGQAPFAFDASANAAWASYRFPGNVRELRNIVIRLAARHAGQIIDHAVLENEFDPLAAVLPEAAPAPAAGAAGSPLDAAAAVDWNAWARRELARQPQFNLDLTLQTIGRALIDAAIEANQGNVSQAAKQLGISRTTLYSRMENKGQT
ncbi:MAG TPA: sigma-54 dependent transcriptional regulator [Rhodocyclaceae bacterium]|nr:sigma-54 dependent transcriptional regulator [Rhodocyclaceae bacterium]